MPLYEYRCKKCGHQFEKIQKYSDRMVKKCPDCGGRVEQTITAPAVQFKGTGWYVTDYAKGSSKDSGKSGNGSPATSSSESKSSEGKSNDSKGSDDSTSKSSSGAEKGSSTSEQPAKK